MRYFLLILLFVFCSSSLYSQDIIIENVEDFDLVRLMNGVTLKSEARTDQLSARILFLADLPGSAGFNSGETTTSIYVAVSGYDELPDQNLFLLKSFYNPIIKEFKSKSSSAFNLMIEYGPSKNRMIKTFLVTLNEINTP